MWYVYHELNETIILVIIFFKDFNLIMCIPLNNFKYVTKKITVRYCSISLLQMIEVVLYISSLSSACQRQRSSSAVVSSLSSSSCFSPFLSCHLPIEKSRTCHRHLSLHTENKDAMDLTRSCTRTNSRLPRICIEESCLIWTFFQPSTRSTHT